MTERIRLAVPSDARALAQLRWDFRSDRGGVLETEAAFVARCAIWIADALARPQWACFVAEHDGAIVGHLWIEIIEKIPNPAAERERHAYITNVYVRPERRGGGIAGRLLDRAHGWCAEQQVDTMFLWPSPLSRPLYARHGFTATDAIVARKME